MKIKLQRSLFLSFTYYAMLICKIYFQFGSTAVVKSAAKCVTLYIGLLIKRTINLS